MLFAELSQETPVTELWVQRFVLEGGPKILLPLDPVSSEKFPRLNQLMLLAERPRTDERLDPYLGTQLLRVLAVHCGVEAIEYPTVLGSYASDRSATNVVVLTESAIGRVARSQRGDSYSL